MSKQPKSKSQQTRSRRKKALNPVLRYIKYPQNGLFAKESLGLGLAWEERAIAEHLDELCPTWPRVKK